jgi:hypothetical protein
MITHSLPGILSVITLLGAGVVMQPGVKPEIINIYECADSHATYSQATGGCQCVGGYQRQGSGDAAWCAPNWGRGGAGTPPTSTTPPSGGAGGGVRPPEPPPPPPDPCEGCLATFRASLDAVQRLEQTCRTNWTREIANSYCSRGRAINQTTVRPPGQYPDCPSRFTIIRRCGSDEKCAAELCATEYRDPDNCIDGWLHGMPGAETSEGFSWNIGFDFGNPAGGLSVGGGVGGERSTTVVFEPKAGLHAACNEIGLRLAFEAAQTYRQCEQANKCDAQQCRAAECSMDEPPTPAKRPLVLDTRVRYRRLSEK